MMTSKSNRFCSVPQCNSYVSKGISLYYFPKDSTTSKEWKHVLKIGKPISKYMNVCSKHFSDHDFVKDFKERKYKRLKKGAIPSQNIPKGSMTSKEVISRSRKTGMWPRMDRLDQSTPINLGMMNLIPEGSKKRYEYSYEKFMSWRLANNVKTFSEKIVLAYFGKLSHELKASTLWTTYSMLKSTIHTNHNVNIDFYTKVKAFLKKAAKNYQAKKSKVLTIEEIQRFFKEAPDENFLLTKVALIIALSGACGRSELHKLKLEDVKDLNSSLLIKMQDPKLKTVRTYTITGQFYEICKKYLALRPPQFTNSRFFLNYRNGKCTCQVVGINKFSGMPKQVASFLNLPKPEEYTGHCFRQSSATLLMDPESGLMKLKPHRGWLSSTLLEGKQHPIQGQGNSESIQTTDNLTQQQPEIVETSTIKEDPLDPLNIETTASENLHSSEDRIRIKEEPNFIYVKQEPDEDQVMEFLEPETEDGVHVKEEASDDQVTRISVESRVDDSVRHSVNNTGKEFDINDLDLVDLMFLDFAKKFKQFTAKTQIKVKSRIGQIMTDAEMNDYDERRGQRS